MNGIMRPKKITANHMLMVEAAMILPVIGGSSPAHNPGFFEQRKVKNVHSADHHQEYLPMQGAILRCTARGGVMKKRTPVTRSIGKTQHAPGKQPAEPERICFSSGPASAGSPPGRRRNRRHSPTNGRVSMAGHAQASDEMNVAIESLLIKGVIGSRSLRRRQYLGGCRISPPMFVPGPSEQMSQRTGGE